MKSGFIDMLFPYADAIDTISNQFRFSCLRIGI